jgi:hypothetical protein
MRTKTYRIEIMNRIGTHGALKGRAVGNDYVVIDRTGGRCIVLSHHGEDRAAAERAMALHIVEDAS